MTAPRLPVLVVAVALGLAAGCGGDGGGDGPRRTDLARVDVEESATHFQRAYGGASIDIGRAVAQLADGGYVLAVETTRPPEPTARSLVPRTSPIETFPGLMRVDALGVERWARSFDRESLAYVSDVIPVGVDGASLATGHAARPSSGSSLPALVRVAPDGVVEWSYAPEGALGAFVASVPTADGGAVSAGRLELDPLVPDAEGPDGERQYDVLVVGTDAGGAERFRARLGDPDAPEFPVLLERLADGDLFVAGSVGANSRHRDVFAMLLGAGGEARWQLRVPTDRDRLPTGVVERPDGRVTLVGISDEADVIGGPQGRRHFLLDLSVDGRVLADRVILPGRAYPPPDITGTPDGGLLLLVPEVVGEMPFGQADEDLALLWLDADGALLSERSIGGFGHDRPWGFDRTADGGLVIVGETNTYGAGSLDIYLVKTDLAGRFPPPPPLAPGW